MIELKTPGIKKRVSKTKDDIAGYVAAPFLRIWGSLGGLKFRKERVFLTLGDLKL